MGGLWCHGCSIIADHAERCGDLGECCWVQGMAAVVPPEIHARVLGPSSSRISPRRDSSPRRALRLSHRASDGLDDVNATFAWATEHDHVDGREVDAFRQTTRISDQSAVVIRKAAQDARTIGNGHRAVDVRVVKPIEELPNPP